MSSIVLALFLVSVQGDYNYIDIYIDIYMTFRATVEFTFYSQFDFPTVAP